MRVSIVADDPGYQDPLLTKTSYAIYLDGKLLPFAVTADDVAGYVDVACAEPGEQINYQGEYTTQRLYGQVKITPVRHRG